MVGKSSVDVLLWC